MTTLAALRSRLLSRNLLALLPIVAGLAGLNGSELVARFRASSMAPATVAQDGTLALEKSLATEKAVTPQPNVLPVRATLPVVKLQNSPWLATVPPGPEAAPFSASVPAPIAASVPASVSPPVPLVVRPRLAKSTTKGEAVKRASVGSTVARLDQEGLAFWQQGDIKSAEQVWRQGLAMAPESNPIRRHLARLLVEAKRDAEALILLEERGVASRRDPISAALLAALYQRQGRHWEAVGLYEQLLETDGQQGTWWLGMAISLEQAGDLGEAVRAYRSALTDTRLGREARYYARTRIQELRP